MVIYIDHEYKCHLKDDDGLVAIETNVFDGKCQAFIEGYRFVPEGKSWVREDGTIFMGEMIAPFKPFDELNQVQRAYERAQLCDMKAALLLLGVSMDE